MTAGLKVSSLAHNLFLFELSSQQEAERVKVGNWYYNGRRLTLDWWTRDSEKNLLAKGQGKKWTRVFGIPLSEWSEVTLRFIGGKCGGFVDANEDTKKRSNLLWARIYVKDSDLVLLCKLELPAGDCSYELSIIMDSPSKVVEWPEEVKELTLITYGPRTLGPTKGLFRFQIPKP